MLCNGAGWPEWLVVENVELMALLKTRNEKSFIGYRDKLIEVGLIEFKKGKKGSPSRYKMNSLLNCTCNLQAQTTVETTVQMPVQTTVHPTASYKQNETKRNNLVVTTAPDGDKRMGDVISHYADVLASFPSTTVVGELPEYLEAMDTDVIIDAIDRAAAEGKRQWSYIKGILRNRKANGIKTMLDVQREQEERSKRGTGKRDNVSGSGEIGGDDDRWGDLGTTRL